MHRLSRLFIPVAIVGALAACGSSSESSPATVAPAATTAAVAPTEAPTTAAAVTEAPAATEAPTTEAPAATEAPAVTEPVTTAAPAATGGTVEVDLTEWTLVPVGAIPAGSVTFNAMNKGNFPHELVVIKGDSYKSLPLDPAGVVLVDQLPAGSVLGETPRIAPGEAAEVTVDLSPGKYVLVCNLAGGGISHAGKGQTFDLTIA